MAWWAGRAEFTDYLILEVSLTSAFTWRACSPRGRVRACSAGRAGVQRWPARARSTQCRLDDRLPGCVRGKAGYSDVDRTERTVQFINRGHLEPIEASHLVAVEGALIDGATRRAEITARRLWSRRGSRTAASADRACDLRER